jgi:hypothetical protein
MVVRWGSLGVGRRAALEERTKALSIASGSHYACCSGQSGSAATGREVTNELRCWIVTTV